jgi:NAD(P)-dependent dehydrogenase (short-subunit alcohol dehydrogenase family)
MAEIRQARMELRRLTGRKILITGAASGIGQAVADRFCAEGAQTVLLDRSARELAEVAGRNDAGVLVVDLLDVGGLSDAASQAAEMMVGLDGLVNCAGVQVKSLIDDVTTAEWNTVLGVNLVAPYFLCQAVVPYLRQAAQASIVNVASGTALVPTAPGSTAYAASKGGLVSFTRALALELAPRIRVNVVCPGMTQTPMVSKVFSESGSSPNLDLYPLRRAADPTEIAAGILFLTSAEASYVTGTVLAIDGGRTFH